MVLSNSSTAAFLWKTSCQQYERCVTFPLELQSSAGPSSECQWLCVGLLVLCLCSEVQEEVCFHRKTLPARCTGLFAQPHRVSVQLLQQFRATEGFHQKDSTLDTWCVHRAEAVVPWCCAVSLPALAVARHSELLLNHSTHGCEPCL